MSALKVTVIGSSRPRAGELDAAKQVGRILAEEKAILVSGGRGGIMSAAAEANHVAGGFSIGILPEEDLRGANPYNSISLPTGIGLARNLPNVLAGDAVVVIGGGPGTLTELGYALQYQKPLLLLAFLAGVSALDAATLNEIAGPVPVERIAAEGDLEAGLRDWIEEHRSLAAGA